MKKVIEASMAVAIAAKLAKPGVIPLYPITPQTHIVERLADFVNNGELNSEIIHCESEHSAMSAAIGSEAAGTRTFTATASQGMALMHEVVFIAAGMRLPIVMAVANRTLSAPINIWNDHQDSISERDSGWLQLFVESAQECLDTTLQAFRIGEDRNVQLPVMVCLDGFTLSHVHEPVEIPEQKEADRFLPAYAPETILDPAKPVSFGPIGAPDVFMHFKQEQQKAIENSLSVIIKANKEFKARFGRSYGNGLVEPYKLADADYAFVAMGSICGTARVAIDNLRKHGKKIGLLKIRSFRPFPRDDIIKALSGKKGVAVFDRDISLGMEGALLTEIKATLCVEKKMPAVKGFIVGLGGRDVTEKHFIAALNALTAKTGNETEWLF